MYFDILRNLLALKTRYFLHLAFRGTRYSGWQRQKNGQSVQQILEESLASVWRFKGSLHACGRTDAGVHAHNFYCHLDVTTSIFPELIQRLNRSLPGDIAIRNIFEVEGDANAQHDALSRTYKYRIHVSKDPQLEFYSTWLPGLTICPEKINMVLDALKGEWDYRGFCLQPGKHDSTICHIREAMLEKKEDRLEWTFTADRFLKGMIRLLVRRLHDVGAGIISGDDFLEILQTGSDPYPYRKRMPPQGLSLVRVEYPFDVPYIS